MVLNFKVIVLVDVSYGTAMHELFIWKSCIVELPFFFGAYHEHYR